MCIHDGLNEKCSGRNCPCPCMNCLMGDEDEAAALMRDAERYVKACYPAEAKGSPVDIMMIFLEHCLKEEPDENAEAIDLAVAIIRGEV